MRLRIISSMSWKKEGISWLTNSDSEIWKKNTSKPSSRSMRKTTPGVSKGRTQTFCTSGYFCFRNKFPRSMLRWLPNPMKKHSSRSWPASSSWGIPFFRVFLTKHKLKSRNAQNIKPPLPSATPTSPRVIFPPWNRLSANCFSRNKWEPSKDFWTNPKKSIESLEPQSTISASRPSTSYATI